jgi:FkbM family methyltransferase
VSQIWDKQQRALQKWQESYRYKYEITSNDIIFDLGGYEGEFTERFLETHSPERVHIFEPVPEFADRIRDKFSDNSTVDVHNYGLKDVNATQEFSIDSNSSSMYTDEPNTEVEIRDVVEVIDELGVEEIRLMKINIEGSEYDLIKRLIESGYIEDIEDVQVQFHKFDYLDEPVKKREAIRKELRRTHNLTYDYYFIWENWKRC